MLYFVVAKDQTAFYTTWFEKEKHWNPDTIYCVVDIAKDQITFDGETWKEIEHDHL